MAKDIFKDAIAKGYQRIFSRRFSHSYALQEPTLGSPIEDVEPSIGQNNKLRILFKGEGVALDSSDPNVVEEGNFGLFMQEECLTAKKTAAGSEVIAESYLNSHFPQTSSTEHQGESYRCGVRVESNAHFATLGHNMAMQRSGLSCTTYLSQAATSSGSSFNKYLAIMNTDRFLLSLAVASQFDDKVIRSSIPTFGILDISHSLHVLNILKSQFSDTCVKELPVLCEETSALSLELPVIGDRLPALCDQLPALYDQSLSLEDPSQTFLDDDDIKIAKVVKDMSSKIEERVLQSDLRVSIPKSIIRSMPPAPNDIETSQPAQEFCIQIRKVALDQVDLVNSCLNWLLKDRPGTTTFLGLACKYADDRSPSLVQLSFHERCLLISLPGRNLLIPGKYPTMLKTVLSENNILKIGADVHKDALALFHFLGLVTNSCIKITHLSTGQRRKRGVSVMFRDLFNWTWMERKKVVNSDWGLVLTLEQVKLAVLEAWSSRLVWIRQSEVWKGEAPYFSLKNMPFELLNYFGRSLFSPGEVSRKDRDTTVEVTGAKIEVHKGFLKLQQTHFRSRVLGLNSTVELQFKNGREPEKYLTMVRRGNKVVLDPDRSESSPDSRKPQEIDIDVDMISKVLVDNSDNDDVQRRKLEDVLYFLLCSPPACPPHILVALGCSIESVGVRPKVYELDIPELDICKMGLNSSQLVAWQHMLTNPMAAVIGPPGTGKTSLIKGVAKAWEHLGDTGEVLLCVAHQNVAVRHMAESMLKEGISGVLLLISEDYYVDWHEEQYTQVKDAIVVSGSQTASGMKTWAFRNKVTVPKVILCTLAVIGSQSFYTSLMGTKVTFMIIDECSQAAEGHLISNLVCLPHLQMLSVLGDPSQLPPYGKPLQSVFDLVAGKCDIKFLHQQYRMPHCISKFVSDEFYQGKLETLTRPDHLHLKPIPKPLMWIHVSGFAKYAAGTKKSLCNEAEAEAIMKYCKEYKRKADEAGVVLTLGKLIVLTLYEGQRTLISRLLKENDLQIVPVYNVDSFQGQEADAVLISLVVGDRGSSFAVDRNRACVLLSRAKRLMHVFGNLDSVKASKNSSLSVARVDTIWRSLASYCESNDWVASEEDLQSVVESSFVTD